MSHIGLKDYKRSLSKHKMIDKTFIYSLSDPDTGYIKYIGKTNQSLYNRYLEHVCIIGTRKHQNYKTRNWIKSLLKKDKYPIIEIIDIVDNSNWEEEEIFYIAYFRYLGFDLKNYCKGGKQGNIGTNWQWKPEALSERKMKELNKDSNLFMYDCVGHLVRIFKNTYDVEKYFNISNKICNNKINRNYLFDKRFFIFKKETTLDTNLLKRRYRKIRVTNIHTGISEVFENIKSVCKHFNINKYLFGIHYNNELVFNENFKFEKI